MDRLAAGGMVFTDAHSSSSVCTPTRYSILTGRYNWRSWMKHGVLNGFSRRLIETGPLDRRRVPEGAGLYHGVHGQVAPGDELAAERWRARPGSSANPSKIDYSRPIQGGPTTRGLRLLLRDQRIARHVALCLHRERSRDRDADGGKELASQRAGRARSFEAIDVLPALTRKAVDYIAPAGRRRKTGQAVLPVSAFGLAAYADSADDGMAGQKRAQPVCRFCDANRRRRRRRCWTRWTSTDWPQNTLVVFTSDNGCSPAAGFPALLAKGHNPSYQFRGKQRRTSSMAAIAFRSSCAGPGR